MQKTSFKVMDEGLKFENSILNASRVRRNRLIAGFYIATIFLTAGLFLLFDYWLHFYFRVNRYRIFHLFTIYPLSNVSLHFHSFYSVCIVGILRAFILYLYIIQIFHLVCIISTDFVCPMIFLAIYPLLA